MISNFESVLDAGCGHGEFTLKMAKYAKQITGFDNSAELLKIAKSLLEDANEIDNLDFVYADTKHEDGLPFEDCQFDLIYARRGPTSIYNYSRILRSGGMIFSIHPGSIDKVKERLMQGGFVDVKIEIFDRAYIYFLNEIEFTKYISSLPGNPDFTLEENRSELEKKVREHSVDGRLQVQELRYIVTARNP